MYIPTKHGMYRISTSLYYFFNVFAQLALLLCHTQGMTYSCNLKYKSHHPDNSTFFALDSSQSPFPKVNKHSPEFIKAPIGCLHPLLICTLQLGCLSATLLTCPAHHLLLCQMLTSLKKYVSLKVYQYELTTSLYMLEPWEKTLFSTSG